MTKEERNIESHLKANLLELKNLDGLCNLLTMDGNHGVTDAVHSFRHLQRFARHPESVPIQSQSVEYLLAREIGELSQTIQSLVKLQQATRNFRLSCETVSKLRKEIE